MTTEHNFEMHGQALTELAAISAVFGVSEDTFDLKGKVITTTEEALPHYDKGQQALVVHRDGDGAYWAHFGKGSGTFNGHIWCVGNPNGECTFDLPQEEDDNGN